MSIAELFTMTAVTVAAVAVAVLASALVGHLLVRYRWTGPTATRLHERSRGPVRTLVAAMAGLAAVEAGPTAEEVADPLAHALLVGAIAAATWLVTRLLSVAEDVAVRRFDVEVKDNLRARRKRTQVAVLRRVVSVAVVLVATAGVLLTFDAARAVGASLLASAGVAGLIAGVAGRSTLGNLVAGVQIAFTEPIRLDDVVVVEGEWGRVEEITLTFVVVRIWDERRLVLPTAYFVENPFQNWTRSKAQILGTVNLHVDYATHVPTVREKLGAILADTDLWDGQVWVLQVIDATPSTMELRALVSAEDAPTAWDLRCKVREELIEWLQSQHPDTLPRLRLTEADAASDGDRPLVSTHLGDGDKPRSAEVEGATGLGSTAASRSRR